MSQNHPATWEDIPPEVLELILAYLDTSTLLNMGKVNHLLNHMALVRILGPRVDANAVSLGKNSSFATMVSPPKEVVPALCAALWFSNISQIEYALRRDNIRTFASDLYGLTVFMAHMPPGSLESFNLRFRLFDKEEIERCSRNRRPKMTREAWKKLLGQLTDTLLSKGCKTLEIRGAPLYPYLHIPKPSSRLAAPSLKSISRLPRTAIRYLFPHTATSRLNSLMMDVPDLFISPLFPHMLHILKQSSRTLRNLELRIVWSHNTARSWDILFISTHLPHLTTLKLSQGTFPSSLPPDTLMTFLSRHPSITHLKIDLSFKGIGPNSDLRVTAHKPILPNLEVLEAWPQLVTWILQSLWGSDPDAGPRNLPKSVLILSTGAGLLEGAIINKAILALNILTPYAEADPLNPDTDGSLSTCLILEMRSDFWVRWIRENAEDPSPFQNLSLTRSRIRRLTMSRDWVVSLLYHQSDGEWVMGRWLSLFPMLEELEINGPHRWDDCESREKWKNVIRRCNRLRMFKYKGVLIPCDG